MRASIALVVTAAITVVVAVARPDVAHLALQALMVAGAMVVLAELARRVVAELPRSRWATGWRPTRRPRAALPSELAFAADVLRERSNFVPFRTVSTISGLFQDRLRAHFGLDVKNPADLPRIEKVLSPHAMYLLANRQRGWVDGHHVLERIPRSWLVPLIYELEHL